MSYTRTEMSLLILGPKSYRFDNIGPVPLILPVSQPILTFEYAKRVFFAHTGVSLLKSVIPPPPKKIWIRH